MERIPKIEVGGARIPRFEPPVVERLAPPVTSGGNLPDFVIPRPVVEVPNVRIDYPVLPAVPLNPPDMGGGTSTQPLAEPIRPRRLPPTPRPAAPQQPQVVAPPTPLPAPPPPPPAKRNTIEIAGNEVVLPTTQEVLQSSTTAIMSTSATLVTAIVFNQARKLVGEQLGKLARNKFKVKLKLTKPVTHFIHEDDGVTIVEYSADGITTLAHRVTDPEKYLREIIETDELFEADHKIVIDEPIREMFSREGAKRFNYFAPSKKLARRLAARFTLF